MKPPKVFLPPDLANLYEKQEKLRVWRVESLKRHHEKSRRFRQRRDFNRYRIEVIARLPGVAVWRVNADGIRAGLEKGDVDFTMGGHGYTHRYVPLREIWIANDLRKKGLWPTIWHEYSERSLMRRGVHYNTAHSYASRLEIALLEGTYFYLPVGTFSQTEDGYCGPAALKIYANYLGKNLSERYLVRRTRTNPEKGTDPVDLVRAGRELGFRAEHRCRPLAADEIRRFCRQAEPDRTKRGELIERVAKQAATVRGRKVWTAAAVRASIRRGRPILANIQLSREYGSGHYVLIIGYTRGSFVLSDPNDENGFREVPVKEFLALWYELVDGTIREGITFTI